MGKNLGTLSVQSRVFIALIIVNAMLLPTTASAVAFLNNPQAVVPGVPPVPFRPLLWNIPTVNGQRTIDYAFAPAGTNLPNLPGQSIAFTAQQQALVNQAVATWNNPGPGANNNVTQNVAGAPDLRTWATHELGHALGLGDPNRPGTINGRTNFNPVQAGGQVVPFAAFAPVDGTTLRQSQVFADRATASAAPYNVATPPPTEAVMIQRLRLGENKHALAFDDVHGLQALGSGPDFQVDQPNDPTPDDFTYVLRAAAAGYTPDDANGNPGQPITLFNANLTARGVAATAPIINRALFPQAQVYFSLDEDLNVLAESDVFFTERSLSESDEFYGLVNLDSEQPTLVRLAAGTSILEIAHVDIFFNSVPEPGALPIVGLGILLLFRSRSRKTGSHRRFG